MRATAKQVGALWFDSFPSAAVRFRVCHSQKGYKNEDRRYTTQQHDSVALWNEAGAWQNLRLFKGGDKKITPESKARAKEVREYALNHLNGQYFTPKQLPTPQKKKKQ